MNEPAIRLLSSVTLECGYWDHEGFCREAILIDSAADMGRLYELPF